MQTQHGGRKHLNQSVPEVPRASRERRVNEVPLVNLDRRASEVPLVNPDHRVNEVPLVKRGLVGNGVRQAQQAREALRGRKATRGQRQRPKREPSVREPLVFELSGASHRGPVNQTRC